MGLIAELITSEQIENERSDWGNLSEGRKDKEVENIKEKLKDIEDSNRSTGIWIIGDPEREE